MSTLTFDASRGGDTPALVGPPSLRSTGVSAVVAGMLSAPALYQDMRAVHQYDRDTFARSFERDALASDQHGPPPPPAVNGWSLTPMSETALNVWKEHSASLDARDTERYGVELPTAVRAYASDADNMMATDVKAIDAFLRAENGTVYDPLRGLDNIDALKATIAHTEAALGVRMRVVYAKMDADVFKTIQDALDPRARDVVILFSREDITIFKNINGNTDWTPLEYIHQRMLFGKFSIADIAFQTLRARLFDFFVRAAIIRFLIGDHPLMLEIRQSAGLILTDIGMFSAELYDIVVDEMVRFRVYRSFYNFVRRRFPHLLHHFDEPHDVRWTDDENEDGEPEETLRLADPSDRSACLNATNGAVRCPIAHSQLGPDHPVVINGNNVCFSARQLVAWVVHYGRQRDPYTRKRYSQAAVELLTSLANEMPEDDGADELDDSDDE